MKYNFDEKQLRTGTHSIKWDFDSTSDIIPMWIADMDFKTFPPVSEALGQITASGHFGYNTVPEGFFDSIILWWQKKHHCALDKDCILPSTGVVAGISAIITALAQPGEEVIIQTPAYNHFFNVIDGCRCMTVENELINENGVYRIDFEDLERKAASDRAKILLLCNPHNPVGRVWTRHELEEVASICARHQVHVISDEIHSDLLSPGREHTTFISVAESQHITAMVVSSASKTFNLSGLHAAYIFVNDRSLRKKIEKQLWAQGSATPSLIACEALIVAYSQGDEWVAELNTYLYENYIFLKTFINTHLNTITVTPLEATYLVWLDCRGTGIRSKELSTLLLDKQKLWVNPGDMYGKGGEGFLRLNIACPRETLQEGLNRFKSLAEGML